MDLKVNLKQALKSYTGDELINEEKGAEVPLTLGKALTMAVMRNDEKDDGEKKLKRYELAHAFHNQEDYEFTPEDLTWVKEEVAKVYAPIVVGAVYTALK